jgi:hypothetical protein
VEGSRKHRGLTAAFYKHALAATVISFPYILIWFEFRRVFIKLMEHNSKIWAKYTGYLGLYFLIQKFGLLDCDVRIHKVLLDIDMLLIALIFCVPLEILYVIPPVFGIRLGSGRLGSYPGLHLIVA